MSGGRIHRVGGHSFPKRHALILPFRCRPVTMEERTRSADATRSYACSRLVQSRASGASCPARPRGRPYHDTAYRRLRTSTPSCHATLVAVTLDLITDLTDQAIDLFDRLVGTMFRKVEWRHARAFQADGRAIRSRQQSTAAALVHRNKARQDQLVGELIPPAPHAVAQNVIAVKIVHPGIKEPPATRYCGGCQAAHCHQQAIIGQY